MQPTAPARSQHALTWHGAGGGGVATARHEAANKAHGGSGQPDAAALAAGMQTLPGVAVYYSEHVHGVPHTLSRLVR